MPDNAFAADEVRAIVLCALPAPLNQVAERMPGRLQWSYA